MNEWEEKKLQKISRARRHVIDSYNKSTTKLSFTVDVSNIDVTSRDVVIQELNNIGFTTKLFPFLTNENPGHKTKLIVMSKS